MSQMKVLHDLGVGVVDLVVPTGLMSQALVLHSSNYSQERSSRASTILVGIDGPI